MLAYAGWSRLFCPAYLRRAVPLALALYGATDVPLRHLLVDSLRLMFGQAVALVAVVVPPASRCPRAT